MQASSISEPLVRTDTQQSTNEVRRSSRLCFFGKLMQTIFLSPVTSTVTLAFRVVKLVTWTPLQAGIYTVSGYHTESASALESAYLDTGKAIRDLLSIPSVAGRVFQDMVSSHDTFVDDLPKSSTDSYLKVKYTKKFEQFSSYQHGLRTFDTICPEGITEFAAASDAALKTIMGSHLFNPDKLIIGFGIPNVYTFVTEKKPDGSVETVKVDAKSLKREPMSYHGTNGKIQSGVFFVPTNLPPEALQRFKEAAEKLQGRADITCINTNCRVLKEAGFSIENVPIDGVIFPNTLMEHFLFRNVFYTDSQNIKHKVHFEILNTTKQTIEHFCEEVDTAVVGTRLRHHRRNADTEENRTARGEAAKALIAEEARRLAVEAEQKIVSEEDLGRRKVTVSVPSYVGNAIARIWGRHTIYEVDLSNKQKEIAEAFAKHEKLQPFPQENPNCSTRLKRDFFFSGPMIRFLRRQMMGRVDEIYLNAKDIFQHLKSTKGARLNYVLLDDKVVLARVKANGDVEEAHKTAADWALSKHALLSERQEVYGAGEMWYDEARNIFRINGDSGTFKPNFEQVKIVTQLANDIFGNFFETVMPNEETTNVA